VLAAAASVHFPTAGEGCACVRLKLRTDEGWHSVVCWLPRVALADDDCCSQLEAPSFWELLAEPKDPEDSWVSISY